MQYKNVSGQDLTVIGIGTVKAGETISTDSEINNIHLQRIGDTKSSTVSHEMKSEAVTVSADTESE